ncbi:MAG: hypothetical protein OXH39_19280 [Candidatus Poribacteria bacterium]|nr:hypothetical protein [Candidatus Poribacteria bacterium]
MNKMSKVWQDLISSGYRIDVHNKSKDHYIDYDNDGKLLVKHNEVVIFTITATKTEEGGQILEHFEESDESPRDLMEEFRLRMREELL